MNADAETMEQLLKDERELYGAGCGADGELRKLLSKKLEAEPVGKKYTLDGHIVDGHPGSHRARSGAPSGAAIHKFVREHADGEGWPDEASPALASFLEQGTDKVKEMKGRATSEKKRRTERLDRLFNALIDDPTLGAVSYTHLTLPTTPYV